MAPNSKLACANPSFSPAPIMPTMWCELMLVPKIEPATAHQATVLPAR